MRKEGKPVPENLNKLDEIIRTATQDSNEIQEIVDFTNTEVAFAGKSDADLKKAAWLFKLMNKQWLLNLFSSLGILSVRLKIPFVERITFNTIYKQFCGGRTLLESQPSIQELADYQVQTVLDYGAEAKDTEEEFNITVNETKRAIHFSATHDSILVVSSKISGLTSNSLLERFQGTEPLTDEEQYEMENLTKRIDSICHSASQNGISVFFDAEESWVQNTIDYLVNKMMARYNKERAVVFNTFQMYRSDRLQYLMDSFDKAKKEGYILGAKLVRGAYMEKERERAAKMGYPSPIQAKKAATDDAYNAALRFCVDNYDRIACCNASHNAKSAQLMAHLIAQRGLQKDHPHFHFSQLYGMSDHLTFNLAKEGYRASKYVPYGPVKEMLPYLIRRAEENSSVSGDINRELKLISTEMKRRKI
jgi:proline dehydrogenase